MSGRRSYLGLLALLCACGGSRAFGDDDGTQSEDSAATMSTADASGEVSASSEAGSSMDDEGMSPDSGGWGEDGPSPESDGWGEDGSSCELIADTFGPLVQVDFINSNPTARYIEVGDNCAPQVVYRLEAEGFYSQPRNPNCWSCETLVTEGCDCDVPPPPIECGVPTLVKVAPGAVYSESVSTTTWVSHGIDDACIAGVCPNSCSSAEPLPFGEYSFHVFSGPTANCEHGGPCDCDPGLAGWCIVPGPSRLDNDASIYEPVLSLPTPNEGVFLP